MRTESTLNNEHNIENEENINSDDINSKDNLEDIESVGENQIVPMTKEFKEIIKIKEIENKKIFNGNIEPEISATNTEREKVKDFVSELFTVSK